MSAFAPVLCPHCGGRALADPSEVAEGQMSCPACGARLRLLPPRSVGARPLRSLEVTLVATTAPPSRFLDELPAPDGVLRLRIRQAGPRVAEVVVVFALAMAAGQAAPYPLVLWPGAALLVWLALWWVAGEEEIVIAGGRLVRRRGPLGLGRPRAIPRADITELTPRSTLGRPRALVVRLRDGRQVLLAAGLGHQPAALRWIAWRLDRALRTLPPTAPPVA